MATIPQPILQKQKALNERLLSVGMTHRSQGKVRDQFELPNHPAEMFPLASNRVSIFNHVLNAEIPEKGEILTALTCFWQRDFLRQVFDTDCVAYGHRVTHYLPKELEHDLDLQKRGMVIKKFPAPDVEDVIRQVLTGTGLKSYQETGMVCGHRLPPGLHDGDMLPYPIYTPTNKSDEDEHITADFVASRYGAQRERLAIQAFCIAAKHAESRGLILADTKLEFSFLDGKLYLVDEKFTPDSSRFVSKADWDNREPGKFPPSLDKQYIRNWGIKNGINKLNPLDQNDVSYVHGLVVPDDVINMTHRIYRYIFWRLTGKKLEVFQNEDMGIHFRMPKPTIEIIVGSRERHSTNYGCSRRVEKKRNCAR